MYWNCSKISYFHSPLPAGELIISKFLTIQSYLTSSNKKKNQRPHLELRQTGQAIKPCGSVHSVTIFQYGTWSNLRRAWKINIHRCFITPRLWPFCARCNNLCSPRLVHHRHRHGPSSSSIDRFFWLKQFETRKFKTWRLVRPCCAATPVPKTSPWPRGVNFSSVMGRVAYCWLLFSMLVARRFISDLPECTSTSSLSGISSFYFAFHTGTTQKANIIVPCRRGAQIIPTLRAPNWPRNKMIDKDRHRIFREIWYHHPADGRRRARPRRDNPQE